MPGSMCMAGACSAVGLVVASISAFAAIWSLLRILERFSAWPFVVYRGLVGLMLVGGVYHGLVPLRQRLMERIWHDQEPRPVSCPQSRGYPTSCASVRTIAASARGAMTR